MQSKIWEFAMIDFFSNLWNWIISHLSLFNDFSWTTLFNHLVKFITSFFLALPLALEREHHSNTLGLRTFPLVAVASCAYILIAETFIGETGNADAKARMMQGLMTGIGFIGGGAIMKEGKNTVVGVATAVSLWSTGTIGAAIAFGRVEIALLVMILNYAGIRGLSALKKNIKDSFED
jgi:putative Mg2+ transporter-C (MgtC) family protein